jgi:hypothetical protein
MKRIVIVLAAVAAAVVLLFAASWPKNEITLSAYAYVAQPDLAAAGRNVYVCWTQKLAYDSPNTHLYLSRSNDNGRSWLNTPIRIDRRSATKGVVERPRLAAYGSYAYAVWRDTRNGKSDIYLNYSSNNGMTWLNKDIRIDVGDAPGASHGYVAEIAVSGPYVYVAWHDMRNGKGDIYVNVSTDSGKTWSATPSRLDGDAPGAADSRYARVAAVKKKVYVVWQDDRNGKSDIYVNYSMNAAKDWLFAPVRLDRGTAAGAYDSFNPRVAASLSACYVVYEDYRKTNGDIYLNYSQNDGANWQARDIRLDRGDPVGKNDSLNPQVAAAGSAVYVVWEDYRNEFTQGPFIFLNQSGDQGNSWLASDMPLDTLGTSAAQAYPQIAAVGNRCCVIWRYGVADSYGWTRARIGLNYTKDKGATWRAEEHWLNPLNSWASTIGGPILGCAGDYVHATWTGGYSYSPVYYNGGNIMQILDGARQR